MNKVNIPVGSPSGAWLGNRSIANLRILTSVPRCSSLCGQADVVRQAG